MTQPSVIHSRISGRNIKPYEMGDLTSAAVRDLSRIGIHIDPRIVRDQIACMDAAGAFTGDTATMDANFIAPITAPSIPTLIQFLQFWLPGFVHVLTTARRIDEIIGITTAGAWEDEEIVQGIVEPAGLATEYGDYTSVPLTNWNPNFEARTIVRGEQGISVGILEEARAARMRLNSSDIKRRQAGINLEIFRNAVGFFGWNSGTGRTFGLLNDPNLPAPITSSVEGGWAKASSSSDAFQKITGDIRMWIATLRTQSGGNIDPKAENIVLALPTNRVDYLSVTTDFGISVRGWIEDTYPKIRIIDAPEFQGTKTTATGGGNEGTPVIAEDNMAYLFVEEFDKAIDGSTDDGSVFSQLVQSKFLTLGVEKRVKTYVEDYSAATAGVLCKRPVGVVRILGI